MTRDGVAHTARAVAAAATSAARVCPSEDTLAALAGGELADSALPRVVLHAVECSACSLQLEAAGAEPELLNGRYRLLGKLGEGGMGVVCEADDLVLGERVALKLLRHELARDERAFLYLKSEVKLARQIGHAHVCRVFDLGSQTSSGETVHFLTMELLRGPSLRSLLAHGALAPKLALKLADQVLSGLQAAHAASVLHRDLKPDNVLLRYSGPHEPHAVITDFGLARAFRAGQRHVTASRTLVGSAAYLAPEQVEEAPLTEASDVYSFGVVLFELLTGEQPFRGETPLGAALKRLHSQPPRPSRVQPSLGERYDAFILRCLARDPTERFHSAAEARAALQTLSEAPTSRAYAPRPFGAALSVLCTAGAMSLWISAEHDSACTRALPLTAAQPKGAELANRASDARTGLLLAAAATVVPGSGLRAEAFPPAGPVAAEDPKALVRMRETPGENAERRRALPLAAAAESGNLRPRTGRVQRTAGLVAMAPGRVERSGVAAESAATQPAQADVLTPDGFLDPFVD